MKKKFSTAALILIALTTASAQVASHTPTLNVKGQPSPANASPANPISSNQVADKIVVRVNGVGLTNRQVVREMYAIFPYARQHNGFPKSEEAQIRKGALEMIIFEELVYQDAIRRKMTVPQATLDKAASDLRKGFASPEKYQEFLQTECKGSRQWLLKKIERSILIEEVLKAEVKDRATVSLAQAQAYYDQNPASFEYPESFTIQTISVIPPANASGETLAKTRTRAEDALRQAKATKAFDDFGLLAEKLSDDDYRVSMGEHKPAERNQLPPPVLQAALNLQPGQVSDLIQLDQAYTVIRLITHTAAGKKTFAEVKDSLRTNLQKKKVDQLRADLGNKLRKAAKVDVLEGPGIG
jgi:parvulin-like peptidyl-prolyl isomerase